MNFNFTDEQRLLSDTVQRFVREHYSFESRGEILRSQPGWSREIWREFANLGLTALNVPERHGGLGAGAVETMLVMNALGAGLVLEPFWSCAVLSPALLDRLDDESACSELLGAMAGGERLAIVAHHEPHAHGELACVATQAEKRGENYVINGLKSVVAHGALADEFLISVRTAGAISDREGISVFRLPVTANGLQVTAYRTIDGQNAADLRLDAVELPPSALVGSAGGAFDAIEAAHHIALSALCAEAVGIMQAVNAGTLEYTRNRKQFGQPISRFQVLQHRMVDMFIHAEQATSMSYLAAINCTAADRHERQRTLSAAKVVIGQAARFIAQQSIQLHGGMGMTDEMMVSHHFKRLTAIDLTLGDSDFHLQQFAALSTRRKSEPQRK